jgi:putative membrane-bound dehydrogenase-like protein
MNSTFRGLIGLCLCACTVYGQDADFPVVSDDFEVNLFARDPLVRNPCAITFDEKGRLFVGMGPQYRRPTPETEGDKVFILIDSDNDGHADQRKEFARGFNNIQGMTWHGDQLWVANAPDLTVLRDVDGDDEADEYLRLYTDLGNIEHGIHGLNWAPDGKLYMSKGNSKGLNQSPDRVAPKAFRDLWGMKAPEGTPDFPPPVLFTRDTYKNTFHHPSDDWGLNGGVLRCRPDGAGLEIVSRGNRNPWDMTFDSQFNWLGTDNDQNLGDKIFSPFFSANFGWGHPWSYDWLGDDHLPSAPSAGPLFEGSGTGVIFCDIEGYPDWINRTFLINDWLKREIYVYRPQWKGAWMRPLNESMETLASAGGGRSMDGSTGRSFDPVDIEIGLDGAIYVSSWGREYGSVFENGEMVNEGRIYKLRPKSLQPGLQLPRQGHQPIRSRSVDSLIQDLSSRLPVRRINAQDELVRRGEEAVSDLKRGLEQSAPGAARETWILWTLGRIGVTVVELNEFFADQWNKSFNRRLQTLRIVAFQARERASRELADFAVAGLSDGDARLRQETVMGLHQVLDRRWNKELLRMIEREEDRLVYYSAWQALRDLLSVSEQKELLRHASAPVRRAALLSLLEDNHLDDDEIRAMEGDPDAMTSFLAQKRLSGRAIPVIKGPALSGVARENDKETHVKDASGSAQVLLVQVIQKLSAESGRTYQQDILANGNAAYTDRSYQLVEIPEELEGHAFIRSANNDAEARQGGGMDFELLFPSTVYVADDVRGDRPPLWLEEKFEVTGMYLKTHDARYRVYRADFPAGMVKLGSNNQRNRSPKASYIVIIEPHYLARQKVEATVPLVLASMETASAMRGRALFHSALAANCMACHQLEGNGNVFAPDLSDIGSRATPEMIARSILDPSAEITEGFASQIVETKDGEIHEGLVVGESGRSIVLANAAGVTVDIAKADIERRTGSETSAMPGGLGAILSSQQVADLVAYLLQIEVANQKGQPRASSTGVDTHSSKHPMTLSVHQDGIALMQGEVTLARYYHQHSDVHRPFWAHVKTPTGRQVTRAYPPVEGVDAMDHAHLHPGLSMGFAVLNGVNFWHNREGRVRHLGYRDVVSEGGSLAFSTQQEYLDGDGRRICVESTRYTIVPNTDGYLIVMDSRFSSDQDFYFGVKEEMGLTMRVATPIVVKTGDGRILNGQGGANEKGTWGKVDRWWDYAGTIEGHFAGIQIMSGSVNPEVWAHSRDYGVLVANPFPVDKAPNRDKKTMVSAGDVFRLQFGIQIHDHMDKASFDAGASYRRFQVQFGERLEQ